MEDSNVFDVLRFVNARSAHHIALYTKTTNLDDYDYDYDLDAIQHNYVSVID